MSKKTIDMVAITPEKANAQNLTCFISFITATSMSIFLMLIACVLPAMVTTTEVICWTSMFLEAVSICFGWVAYWLKTNTL